SGLKLTIARYYTPKGRSIQELGITPDYVVESNEVSEKSVPREKDLRRHFRRESGKAPEARPAPATAAVDWPEWSEVTKLPDRQLKAALSYLHRPGVAGTAPTRTEARATP